LTGSCKHQEGCLSVPGFYEDIERAEHIIMEYQDRYGEKKVIDNQEFLAIALQHEMDHLQGKMFVDYLSRLKQDRIRKKMLKRRRSE
jgi:peptide deformylase